MRRTLYDEVHEDFRSAFRRFLEKKVTPFRQEWEDAGRVPRDLFTAAGESGFLGLDVPEQYGGGGVADFRFNAVISEEIMRCGASASGLGLTLHNDVCIPYLLSCCSEEQKQRWLPGVVSGELICAIALTEPGAGSDLAAMSTVARRERDNYVVDGAKTFITNGINADLVITAVKTDPTERHRGISLVMLERGMAGFERGGKLQKLGQHAQDTAELSFGQVRVPVSNLMGDREGLGFGQMVANLAQERLCIAVSSVAAARAALTWTLEYVRERKAFGKSIGTFQNTRFVLAEVETEIDIAEHYVDDCVRALNAGELTAVDAAKAKYWCTELQGSVVDRCLQLHGGYGYMTEYPISRAYADARATRIYGGTTEIMKEVIGRSLGL
jgi:alkylation response protein AidB-like acyl-CoA dehydrogenase